MKNIFILYDLENEEAKSLAEKVNDSLNSKGYEISDNSLSDAKAAVLQADFLLFIACSKDDFSNLKIGNLWRSFLDELTWKRKESGEIIIVADEKVNLQQRPFKLKQCRFVKSEEIESLEQLFSIMPIITETSKPYEKTVKLSDYIEKNESALEKTIVHEKIKENIVVNKVESASKFVSANKVEVANSLDSANKVESADITKAAPTTADYSLSNTPFDYNEDWEKAHKKQMAVKKTVKTILILAFIAAFIAVLVFIFSTPKVSFDYPKSSITSENAIYTNQELELNSQNEITELIQMQI